MCSLCCLCTYPATPISNRPPAMCGQHEPPVRPAAPRFESRRCDLCQSWGEDEPDSLRYLKVANRSGSEVEGSPARAEAQRSEREKGGDFVPGDSKGRSPWRAFGDFLRDGKVTRGGGAERPPHGGCGGRRPPLRWSAEEGVSPPRIGVRRGPQQAAANKTPEATFRFCSHIIRKRKSVRTQNAKRSDLP